MANLADVLTSMFEIEPKKGKLMRTMEQVTRTNAIVHMLDDLISLAGNDNYSIQEELSTCRTNIEGLAARMDDVSPDADEECVSMLMTQGWIQAIKLYREKTGFGLKRSKEAIDRLHKCGRMFRGKRIPPRNLNGITW